MDETQGGSAQANPTNAMAFPVPVVDDDGDDTAAPRERFAPSAAAPAAASLDIVGPSSRPPPVPILHDDDAPPALRRRLSVAPLAPRYVEPEIPQSPGSRAAVAVIAETQDFSSSSSVASSSVPGFSSAASTHSLPGASSPVSLDNGYESERDDRELAKHALKFIVAEIDSKIIETGSVGGTLLTRFAKKGLKYQVTVNPFRGSVLWKMEVPQIGQDPASVSEVPYILFVLQGEEFCNLISTGAFLDHVHTVQSRYPTFTICYVTNKLMNYMKMREGSHYLNPSGPTFWRHPPVEEEGLCKIETHYAGVHSRQCADDAEVAEHVAGLTSSLANCKFRKPPTWLSVHANGVRIPKIIIDSDLSRKDAWMKSLLAIPRVQPRFALAIWKKYTMRSLLNAYMDSSKTDLEKELLLQNLMCEDQLGEESRRLGPVCSRRVYNTLMGQNGSAEVDPAFIWR
uniref:Uncharacterized protein n=1 Tax=Avena sativa TaxID=4498 RepID=A0ACD5Z898_AVESA